MLFADMQRDLQQGSHTPSPQTWDCYHLTGGMHLAAARRTEAGKLSYVASITLPDWILFLTHLTDSRMALHEGTVPRTSPPQSTTAIHPM